MATADRRDFRCPKCQRVFDVPLAFDRKVCKECARVIAAETDLPLSYGSGSPRGLVLPIIETLRIVSVIGFFIAATCLVFSFFMPVGEAWPGVFVSAAGNAVLVFVLTTIASDVHRFVTRKPPER